MDVRELDYELPEERIAQHPLPERDAARMLVLDGARIEHGHVRQLPQRLPPALFVLNDTRVFPARLRGHKPTGGRAELLLLERIGEAGASEHWLALGRASKPLAAGTELQLGAGLRARVEERVGEGRLRVRLSAPGSVQDAIERAGEVPLPPYIRRAPEHDDRARYQTVFAQRPGAVAAPTAGLHLSERLLGELEQAGHRLARVTLHVGPGTFQPVKAGDLESHRMHAERYEVPESAAAAIAEARREGRPVVAVGTTVVRTLESAARDDGTVRVESGTTDLFIRPGFRFRAVDALLTNFHLPRSTLLALVMAFGGIEPVRAAYREAVEARYRFFSYGDAMLIAPRAAPQTGSDAGVPP